MKHLFLEDRNEKDPPRRPPGRVSPKTVLYELSATYCEQTGHWPGPAWA